MIRVNKVLVKAMGKPAGIIERIVGSDGCVSYSFTYLSEYFATSKRPVHPTLPLSHLFKILIPLVFPCSLKCWVVVGVVGSLLNSPKRLRDTQGLIA